MLNADYFRRIDAMHYVLAHDDGQAQPGLAEADVVLVGRVAQLQDADLLLSGQSGHQGGQRAAGAGPAGAGRDAGTVHCPVIGLTLDAAALIEIRRHRLRLIAARTAPA